MKMKLVKAIMLGLCLSALSTNVAFAQMTGETTPASVGAGQSAEMNILYEKQSEIDRYLFDDHAKEIEEKGIFVNYTGVADNLIEIGISPYTEENANYLYDIFGKDVVKVVEFDQSVIYASGVAEPAASDAQNSGEDKVYKDSDANVVTAVKTVSAAETSDNVKRGSDETATGLSTPLVVLGIAAGAAVVGGAVIVSNKKKPTK